MIKKIASLTLFIPIMAFANQIEMNPNLRGFHINEIKNVKQNNLTYVETTDEDKYLQYLFHFKENSKNEIKKYNNANELYDTHLKNHLDSIKLSIPYQLKGINQNQILGYAPIGSYENGWTGIRVFFYEEKIGTCSFSYEKILAVVADSNKFDYEINSKPTFKSIKGNNNAGFLYTVSWDQDKKSYVMDSTLECVNKNMDPEIINKMIILANQIDRA